MRRFYCFRPNPPAEYLEQGLAAPPDEVQFEGVIFTDGTCVIRWKTQYKSHSVWESFEDLIKVHGHPEYGTEIRFIDPPVGPPPIRE